MAIGNLSNLQAIQLRAQTDLRVSQNSFPQNPNNGNAGGGKGQDTISPNGGGAGSDRVTLSEPNSSGGSQEGRGFGGLGGIGSLSNARSLMDFASMQQRWQEPTIAQAQASSHSEAMNTPVNYVGGKNPDATVAVIDSFSRTLEGDVNHGEAVTTVLKNSGNLKDGDIQKIDDGILVSESATRLLMTPGAEPAAERLSAAIELSGLETLKRTNVVLSDIAHDPNSKIKTINQSQSTSRMNAFSSMESAAFNFDTPNGRPELTEAGKHIFEGLGLPENTDRASMRAFAERSFAKIDDVFSNSPAIQAERAKNAEVSKKLADKGVSYVISAGNDRESMEAYKDVGLKIPATFDDNLLANPNNVVVGAIDTKGTAATNDDTMASFSSTDPEVDFTANGVNVQVQQGGQQMSLSGTSFSSPYVAGKLHQTGRSNPSLSPAQTQNLLRNQSGASVSDSSIAVIR